MKIWYIKLKLNIIPITFLLFTICLIIFSKSNITTVKSSLNIWINNVVPSLLPFFMATELLNHTNIPNVIGNLFNKIMRPLFNVPGIGAYALFMGVISGYPIGAKIVTNFRNNNQCTKEEAERLITFTNNSGPLFILGTVGITLFYDISIGILLLFTHILACISVGIIFRFWKITKRRSRPLFSPDLSFRLKGENLKGHAFSDFLYNRNLGEISYYIKNKEKRNIDTLETTVTFNSLGEVLSKSILSAINSVVLIGGFIILFGIILSILQKTYILNILKNLLVPCFNLFNISTDFIVPILTGILELTNGVSAVSCIASKNLAINIIICAFLLGFGGISIMLQVLSIISKADISIKPYILGKLLHGTLAAFYTFAIISNFSYFSYLKI